MKYRDLYYEWKNRMIGFGFTDPSETTEEYFKHWLSNQIKDMWKW